MLTELFDPFLLQLILIGGLVTLINRLAGHYILARFEPINFRLEAALEAVPVAVMTTLVVPAVANGGWPEWLCLVITMVLCLHVPFVVAAFGAVGVLVMLRYFM